jgi:hypothetical protein
MLNLFLWASNLIYLIISLLKRHILIVFGGLHGIEAGIEADEKLKVNKIEQVFDFVCESKNEDDSEFGTRTVRLEVSNIRFIIQYIFQRQFNFNK